MLPQPGMDLLELPSQQLGRDLHLLLSEEDHTGVIFRG